MESPYLRFNIGKFECVVISDGWLIIPDPPSAGGQSDMHHGNRTDLSCLLINTGKHHVLIDTGSGDSFQPTAGKLVQNMKAAGISPDDIDTIVYTHSHLDHVGGSFDKSGKATFANARYVISENEWECLLTRPERSSLAGLFAAARQNLLSIPGQFDLVENNTEVLPGIKIITAPGHTPGNTVLEITSAEDQLLVIGDIIHLPLEFTRPNYYSFLDIAPEQAVRNRNEILSRAAASGRLVFACHFAFPGLGHITKNDGQFAWQPLK